MYVRVCVCQQQCSIYIPNPSATTARRHTTEVKVKVKVCLCVLDSIELLLGGAGRTARETDPENRQVSVGVGRKEIQQVTHGVHYIGRLFAIYTRST